MAQQNHPATATPAVNQTTTTMDGADELLQAQAELWCHGLAYLRSIALQCAIKIGIPTAIHRCGGAASLPELHASSLIRVPASKRACLSRIMKLLAASGIFREREAGVYCLTPVSRLLVEDDTSGGGHTSCQSPLVLLCSTPFHFGASQRMAEWLIAGNEDDDDGAAETPLMMTYGMSLYDLVGRDTEFGTLFYKAMSGDSHFVAEILLRQCGEVFAGATSVVDVGGGDGTTAKAIAKAFPHVRCSVLELPQVVDSVPPLVDSAFVLHNWSDKDCARILRRAKEAVSAREPKGKTSFDTMVLVVVKDLAENNPGAGLGPCRLREDGRSSQGLFGDGASAVDICRNHREGDTDLRHCACDAAPGGGLSIPKKWLS
ncbi:hypothetical protein PR202_ga21594 [Eleusine coracana subsp. coracana]|uniref:Uncharacterized protein n=1 Tax=Eleusine coracana subsp. coracana TaxID=191504 RepID=A0AAV5CZI6_ELECO|nr:hypothetical protein PR202_ga21594 [Eleusine coracana subsp. coracana]